VAFLRVRVPADPPDPPGAFASAGGSTAVPPTTGATTSTSAPRALQLQRLLAIGLSRSGEVKVCLVGPAGAEGGGGAVLWHLPPALVACTRIRIQAERTPDEDLPRDLQGQGQGRPCDAVALYVGTKQHQQSTSKQQVQKYALRGGLAGGL
jgi:hypothetical protein